MWLKTSKSCRLSQTEGAQVRSATTRSPTTPTSGGSATTPTEETTYVGDLYERVVDLATGDVEHRFHIHGPERPVAVVKRPEGGTPTTR